MHIPQIYPIPIIHQISKIHDENPTIPVTQVSIQNFQHYLKRNAKLRDREVHHQLRRDLVEHIWERFRGNGNGK